MSNAIAPTFMQPTLGLRLKRFEAPVALNSCSVEPVQQPAARLEARSPAEVSRPTHDALPAEVERELVTILEATAPAHLPSSHAYKLREEALLFVMSTLTVAQSKRLHTRLVAQVSNDVLAATFHLRLVSDRRNRILQFLAAAQRRQVLRGAR